MRASGRVGWSSFVAVAVGVLLAALLTPAAGGAGTPGTPVGSALGRSDRALLAQARASGDSTVTLLIATRIGATRDVVRRLQALGARVAARDDDVGYVRAVVPIARAEQAARLDGVVAADLDDVVPLDDPRPDGQVTPTPQTPPSAATPAANPYLPIGDTGAAQFVADNPTWDGRGVTVGVVDTGITLDHPALA
ncbi:MAG TPA: hypothetical protein VFO65_00310, partial [Acidimicrobiales bacterium]|nr:hypothetical protein [Acidimicrobiales bacterium]